MAKLKLIIPGPVNLIINNQFVRMRAGDVTEVPEPHATRLVEAGQFELVGAPAAKPAQPKAAPEPENKKAPAAPVKTAKEKTSKGRK